MPQHNLVKRIDDPDDEPVDFEIGDSVIITDDIPEYDGIVAEVVGIHNGLIILDLDIEWAHSEKIVVLPHEIEHFDEDLDDELDECDGAQGSDPSEPSFYILWNPNGHKPPFAQFETRDAADETAHRMAEQHGGTFYVCLAVGYQKRHEVVVGRDLG